MTGGEETFLEETLFFYCLKCSSGPQIMLLRPRKPHVARGPGF